MNLQVTRNNRIKVNLPSRAVALLGDEFMRNPDNADRVLRTAPGEGALCHGHRGGTPHFFGGCFAKEKDNGVPTCVDFIKTQLWPSGSEAPGLFRSPLYAEGRDSFPCQPRWAHRAIH